MYKYALTLLLLTTTTACANNPSQPQRNPNQPKKVDAALEDTEFKQRLKACSDRYAAKALQLDSVENPEGGLSCTACGYTLLSLRLAEQAKDHECTELAIETLANALSLYHHETLPRKYDKDLYVFWCSHYPEAVDRAREHRRQNGGRDAEKMTCTGISAQPPTRWRVIEREDPMTDRAVVTAQVLVASENLDYTPSVLAVHCDENSRISAWVAPARAWFGPDDTRFEIRIDENPSRTVRGSLSTDRRALFFPKPVDLVRELSQGKRLLVRYRFRGRTAVEFPLLGASKALSTVMAACGLTPEELGQAHSRKTTRK